MGCHALLQGIFWTQGSNCVPCTVRQIFYHCANWEAYLNNNNNSIIIVIILFMYHLPQQLISICYVPGTVLSILHTLFELIQLCCNMIVWRKKKKSKPWYLPWWSLGPRPRSASGTRKIERDSWKYKRFHESRGLREEGQELRFRLIRAGKT